jgi:hypothetical protein
LFIKNSFVDAGWVVKKCSYYDDSSYVVGADGYDGWLTPSNLRWAYGSGARSWIVLQRTNVVGTGDTLELLLVCVSTTSGYEYNKMSVALSMTGFSGGTTTTNPTASDAYYYLTTAAWHGLGNGVVFETVAHRMYSTNYEQMIIPLLMSGDLNSLWYFGKAKNPVSGWTHPFLFALTLDAAFATLGGSAKFLSYHNGGWMTLYCSTESHVADPSVARLTASNEISGEFLASPIGLVSETGGTRGRHGMLFDTWFTHHSLKNGTTLPADGSRQRVVFPDLLLPWDGSSSPQVV